MIYVDNRQEKIEVSEILIENLKKVIQFTLMEEEVDVECEVSLLFVDNEEIREINNETRSIDRETDVLSFPMLEYQDKKYSNNCIRIMNFHKVILMEMN